MNLFFIKYIKLRGYLIGKGFWEDILKEWVVFMKIIIRADRKIGKEIIAEHLFHGKRIIDKVVDFVLRTGERDIYVVSDKNLKVKNAKKISLSEVDSLGNRGLIDLRYVYEGTKLKRFIKKGKPLEKAIIKESEAIRNLDDLGCIYEEREWNPISGFYVLPLGMKIASWLSKTKVSPNLVTFFNVIFSILISSLVLLGGRLNLFLFGVGVMMFHIFDAIDGRIAKLKGQCSLFGKWIDGGGDRFIMNVWYLAITVSLYLKSGKVFFLVAGLILFFGEYMYHYLLLTSVAYFRNFDSDYTSSRGIMQSPLVKFLLFFLNMDIQLTFIIICAWINKFEFLILFYAFYFNFVWFMYFLFYLRKYILGGDVKEA